MSDSTCLQVIYTCVRRVTAEELEWYTEDCIRLKQEFPSLIVGNVTSIVRSHRASLISHHNSVAFDLVGHEDSLRPLIDYLDPLLKFKQRQADLGIDIPYVFHAGETAGDGTKADLNLYDAILLGTKRIGHG